MIVAVAAFFLFLYFLGEATDARRMDPSTRARRTARPPRDVGRPRNPTKG
jgi:hypothetical protein